MPKKILNVLFATEDFYPSFIGGQGIYGYHLVSKLAKLGANVTVLTENRPGRKKFWQNKKNIHLSLIPFCFGNQLFLAILEYFKFILNHRKEYFDILHANQLSGLFFVFFKSKNIGTIIVSAHNTNYDMYKESDSFLKRLAYLPLIFLERLMYKKANALLFNSPDEEKSLLKYYTILNKRVNSIYLGTKTQTIKNGEKKNAQKTIRKKLKLNNEAKIILYIGRLVKRKKVDTLLKALKLLYEQGENIHGVIIGEGPEKQNLLKLAPLNCSLLGYIPNTKPYFLASDAFVTISVAEGGIALSSLEAASFGLPLLLSPSSAGCPILEDGKNGHLVNPNDPHELAQKIKSALTQKEKMGKESKKLAKFFTWERTANETLKFYQSLL